MTYAINAEKVGLIGPFSTEAEAEEAIKTLPDNYGRRDVVPFELYRNKLKVAADEIVQPVYEYRVTIQYPGIANPIDEFLSAVDDDHAREEASYVYDGVCVAVMRGHFLHPNCIPPK